MKPSFPLRGTILAIFLLCVAGQAAAQGTDATLSGAVTDPAGLPVAGAVVSAQNVKTGVVLYRITAEHEGFRKLVYNEVELQVGARISLNLQLEIGAISQSVEVTAQSETLLGYTTSSVGGLVTGQKVLDVIPSIPREAPRAVVTAVASKSDRLALTLLIEAFALSASTWMTSWRVLSARTGVGPEVGACGGKPGSAGDQSLNLRRYT